MFKRVIAILAFGFVALTGMTGCYSTGKATGEGVEKTQEGAQDFRRGYDAGRQ